MLAHETAHLHNVFFLIQRQQRDWMVGFLQLADCRIPHRTGRRVRHLDARLPLQVLKFLKQPIIDSITDAGRIEIVILMAITVEPGSQILLFPYQFLIHHATSSFSTRNAMISVSFLLPP